MLHVPLLLSALFGLLTPASATTRIHGQDAPAEHSSTVILYDTIADSEAIEPAARLGAQPVLMIYQSCDPECSKTGVIDAAKVIAEIERVSGGHPPEWGMLDFEAPFMEWLEAGMDSPKWRTASTSMIQTMQLVRARFPGTRWTYYQIPNIRYWVGGTTWDLAADDVRKRTLESMGEIYGPIARACDWLSPSIYCFYDPQAGKAERAESVRRAGRAWRYTQTAFSRLLLPGKPIIPIMSPLWQINGDAPVGRPVPSDQLLEDVIEPCIQAGATGLVIWTAYRYYITEAIADRKTDQADFDRKVIAEELLGGTPADWQDPSVKTRALNAASRVVLRTIKAIHDAFNRAGRKDAVPRPNSRQSPEGNPPSPPHRTPTDPHPAPPSPGTT